MASSSSAPQGPHRAPNTAFRRLRGTLSPAEFAAAVRRAAREIGEHVACDARYIGRVEAGEIRCPNYAYERVLLHMFPGRTLTDMGFADRDAVRGRAARRTQQAHGGDNPPTYLTTRHTESRTLFGHHSSPNSPTKPGNPNNHTNITGHSGSPDAMQDCSDSLFICTICSDCSEIHEESDVLRRAFMTGGPAVAMAAMPPLGAVAAAADGRTSPGRAHRRVGETEAEALEQAVRRIRLLDDRHGADALYQRAGNSLRSAYELLDKGTAGRQSVTDRLHNGAGELAISVGWLAHDSERFDDARSHYAEALATARVATDPALEAHAFCNTAFLARDAGRPREAVRAAQAGQQAAKHLGSARLLSLLSMREAGGWAGLGDRTACQEALSRARALFERGPSDPDPAWMSFFGDAELAGLEAQCWSALHELERAAAHARRAVALQNPHFVRNRALFTAELAGDLAALKRPEEAAKAGGEALALLGPVQSSRIRGMLGTAARRLRPYAGERAVDAFLEEQSRAVPKPRTA
ncbi:transcriptional regulator [Streptomyces abyssalis]|uniref:Transcriptional regulator n=1 Tax=Streptomyces abyssalis TaxID=933944 RepID=A0A1E7JJG9_9ACTN|nr:transcriptional regulator [Streptomyces abyssalis]OEU87261.1 transcriptional regulator [Streptomyces abyssalis]OEU87794.1 transcriptional regulator [Streptomyces abyssalis]